MNMLAGIAVALIPFLAVIALLDLTNRIARRRERIVGRQIALTDAIHRELGAVTAPVVRRVLGGWHISMAVPLDRPGITAVLVRITEQMFASDGAEAGRLRIVLTPRNAPSTATDGRVRPRGHRLDPATPAIPAFR